MNEKREEIIYKDLCKLPVQPNLLSDPGAGEMWESIRNELHFTPDGGLNITSNVLDKHLGSETEKKIALIWLGDKDERMTFTYAELIRLTNQYANYLRSLEVSPGERVFVFLPRIPALYTAVLGILKVGAVAGTMFSAFQEQALLDRLSDSGAKVLFTTKELGQRLAGIKDKLPDLKKIVEVDSSEFIGEIAKQNEAFNPYPTQLTDKAFMLYTSGTTGKPKGVVHTHNGIFQHYLTGKWVLDLHEKDIYWCTADPGWVTGIVYGIFAPWMHGVTSVVHAGRFDPATWYEILAKEKVTVWYTAPTAIRMLMAKGDELVKQYDLSALRHLCSVGEPLNPEAIWWGVKVFGKPFHDTWWQTETGGMMMVNLPYMDIKVGSMGKPFPGISAGIVDDEGKELLYEEEGNLAFRPGWPAMMSEIWKREEKYRSYFVNGWYISGDRAWKDKDGYYWFLGRVDDVIKTAGERVGPFEVESALVEHPAVAEAGVIGKPDPVRGEIVKAFVVLKNQNAKIPTSLKLHGAGKDQNEKEKLKVELMEFVKKHLAGHAYPREIEFIDKLPKTRSGKIMRRILKAKELGQEVGDTSTLEEY